MANKGGDQLLLFLFCCHYSRRRAFIAALLSLVLVVGWVGPARSDFAKDEAECSDALVGLATCLTYVEGSARTPTPDCCAGLKQVLGKSPKCLCILVKDRNDPQLGFKVDADRAMSLPSICTARANISHCPDLLKLTPGSKEAQIFEQFGNASRQDKGASGTGGASSGGGSGGSKPKDSTSNGGWLQRMESVGGARLCCVVLLVSSLVILGD